MHDEKDEDLESLKIEVSSAVLRRFLGLNLNSESEEGADVEESALCREKLNVWVAAVINCLTVRKT